MKLPFKWMITRGTPILGNLHIRLDSEKQLGDPTQHASFIRKIMEVLLWIFPARGDFFAWIIAVFFLFDDINMQFFFFDDLHHVFSHHLYTTYSQKKGSKKCYPYRISVVIQCCPQNVRSSYPMVLFFTSLGIHDIHCPGHAVGLHRIHDGHLLYGLGLAGMFFPPDVSMFFFFFREKKTRGINPRFL